MSPAPVLAHPEAPPAAFDPAAYVGDLEAIGCRVELFPRPGKRALFCIGSPKGRGFGRDFCAVSARWWPAIEADPGHVGKVVAYLVERAGVTS